MLKFDNFEAYHQINYDNPISTINNQPNEWTNSTKCFMQHYEMFFKYFKGIQVILVG